MHRFYIPSQNIIKDKITISDIKQIHYIKDVLRCRVKDRIIIFDGQGNECMGLIKAISSKSILVNIEDKRLIPPDDHLKITVACAIPKGRKMDEIIDKLTQLGIDRIIPLKTKRMIFNWDDKKIKKQLKRWQEISINAAGQSGRLRLLIIEPLKDVVEVFQKEYDYDLKLIPTLSAKGEILREVLAESKAKKILILIGPEGDFTEEEVDLAKRAGFIPVSLGNLVLRVETAAVAVASFIRLYENF